MMDFCELTGRRVLILGTDGDLAAAVSSVCAAAGASVMMHDPTGDDVEKIGSAVLSAASNGKLNGLVFIPGLPPTKTLQELTVREERDVVERSLVTLTAAIQVLQKKKVSEKCGVVVISSVRSQGGAPGCVLQAIMAGALSTAVRTLASELTPRGMRVNAVLPPLELTAEGIARLAETVRFLLSDVASLINGTNLVSDGGYLQH